MYKGTFARRIIPVQTEWRMACFVQFCDLTELQEHQQNSSRHRQSSNSVELHQFHLFKMSINRGFAVIARIIDTLYENKGN